MRTLQPSVLLSILCGMILFCPTVPTAQAGLGPYYRYYRDAIQDDLLAIPAGTPATDEQKRTLSADLTGLFPYVYPLPTVTIDFLADRLAGAASAGHLAPAGVAAVAQKLVFLLRGGQGIGAEQFADLQARLTEAGANPTEVKQTLDAVQGLQYSYNNDDTSVSLNNDLRITHPEAAGYRRARGQASLIADVRPTFNNKGIVTSPASLDHVLNVQVAYLPLGKYHVSVTTAPNGDMVELGTFSAHKTPPATDHPGVIIISPYSDAPRFASVSFGDLPGAKPVPARVALDRVTGVTITDAEGITRFTASFTASAPGVSTIQSAKLLLRATAAAPTVGGFITFDNIPGYDPDRDFALEAKGFPANATLTLAVNGKVVGPVRTGPTGKLYIKEYKSPFTGTPEPTETVNLLPDAADLSTAKTFTLSDTQGIVLASAGE